MGWIKSHTKQLKRLLINMSTLLSIYNSRALLEGKRSPEDRSELVGQTVRSVQ